MNIHVLLTDYSALLFAGAIGMLRQGHSLSQFSCCGCFHTRHRLIYFIVLPNANERPALRQATIARDPWRSCVDCAIRLHHVGFVAGAQRTCRSRRSFPPRYSTFTRHIFFQVNIVLDEVSSKRRLRLERYRQAAALACFLLAASPSLPLFPSLSLQIQLFL
jgi:hypothetical protein